MTCLVRIVEKRTALRVSRSDSKVFQKVIYLHTLTFLCAMGIKWEFRCCYNGLKSNVFIQYCATFSDVERNRTIKFLALAITRICGFLGRLKSKEVWWKHLLRSSQRLIIGPLTRGSSKENGTFFRPFIIGPTAAKSNIKESDRRASKGLNTEDLSQKKTNLVCLSWDKYWIFVSFLHSNWKLH